MIRVASRNFRSSEAVFIIRRISSLSLSPRALGVIIEFYLKSPPFAMELLNTGLFTKTVSNPVKIFLSSKHVFSVHVLHVDRPGAVEDYSIFVTLQSVGFSG